MTKYSFRLEPLVYFYHEEESEFVPRARRMWQELFQEPPSEEILAVMYEIASEIHTMGNTLMQSKKEASKFMDLYQQYGRFIKEALDLPGFYPGAWLKGIFDVLDDMVYNEVMTLEVNSDGLVVRDLKSLTWPVAIAQGLAKTARALETWGDKRVYAPHLLSLWLCLEHGLAGGEFRLEVPKGIDVPTLCQKMNHPDDIRESIDSCFWKHKSQKDALHLHLKRYNLQAHDQDPLEERLRPLANVTLAWVHQVM
jgi:hypothetical protein